MEVLTAALAALSVFSLGLSFLHGFRSRLTAQALLKVESAREEGKAKPFRGRRLPGMRRTITRLGEAFPDRAGGGTEALLRDSGSAWAPSFLKGLRIAAALASSLLALPLGTASLLLGPFLFAGAYQAPLVILKRRARRRREELAGDLPEIVDLMAVLCYAGEGLHAALEHSMRACAHSSSRAAMEGIVERMRLGESVSEALRHTASHPGREMRRFCRTLLRADETGAPIADILEELAVEFRNARRERERVRAARVSIYILFPLVFMILPSFMLLTVGGIMLGNTL